MGERLNFPKLANIEKTDLPTSKQAWRIRQIELQEKDQAVSPVVEYAKQTSLHGLKYLADRDANILEKFLWTATFLLGLCTSMLMIWIMWTKWELSPILISLENTDVPITDLVFPAVSICNVNKISEKRLRTLVANSRKFANVTENELVILLGSLLKYDLTAINDSHIVQIQERLQLKNFTTADLVKFMQLAGQPCNSMIRYCTWQGKEVSNCSVLFKPIPSSEGFCCAFNNRVERSKLLPNGTLVEKDEENHTNSDSQSTALDEGVDTGLTVLLDTDINDYALPTSPFYGFKVLIHHPNDMPNAAGQGFAVGPGNEVFAGIRMHSVKSTSDVEKLQPKKRNCYFRNERSLQYFSSYSKSNCVMENKADYILTECGCLPFYYPIRRAFNVCTVDKNLCLYETEAKFHQTVYTNCLPDCNNVAFTVDVSEGPFPNAIYLDPRYGFEEKLFDNIPYTNKQDIKDNLVLLHVFFRERTGIQYRRDVRYGWHDFVSSVGGLLGLGLGFSFLSFVEIVYFFGLRWCIRNIGHLFSKTFA